MKLNARQLRTVDPEAAVQKAAALPRRDLYLILENIYDTYNIGGLFRLADALAAKKLYLCGETETPPNARIRKASIGTDKLVPWEYKKTALEAVEDIRKSKPDTRIVAVEQSVKAVPLGRLSPALPVALLVGNETYGVLPETLAAADTVVEIPMWGINKSLNVIVSAAIVGYHVAPMK